MVVPVLTPLRTNVAERTMSRIQSIAGRLQPKREREHSKIHVIQARSEASYFSGTGKLHAYLQNYLLNPLLNIHVVRVRRSASLRTPMV